MNKKRKVVIVGSAWPLRGGGISTFNERLARAFTENGDDVTIYSFSLQYPTIFFPGTSQYTDEPAPDNINIVTKINSINPVNWYLIGKEIAKQKPDFVLFRFWIPFMAPCLGTIARIIKGAKIKTIAIVDNIIPHEQKPFDRFLAKYFVGGIDFFITMSRAVLKDLEKFDNKKPKQFTVHPLYDNFGPIIPKKLALKNLNLEDSFSYILFFGFIREYKGLDLLLKAFANKNLRKFPLKILIAGEFYVSEKPYLELIDSLGLTDDVILKTEFIPNEEVVNYFCASTLVVQPYKEATQSGITQVAYHFEKPMITTRVGGLSEIVIDQKVGFVVNPDSEEISKAIFNFFENNLYDEFSINIKEEKKRFSWETMIETIEDLIEK
ncbi:MAG TPA: glycosyltransferase [Bacteroidales bacterium]|nr:glycosyltransferase [Bacteroidales bacterium]HRX96634.1 glycosyltransferase [Bacteroidales bacterium]